MRLVFLLVLLMTPLALFPLVTGTIVEWQAPGFYESGMPIDPDNILTAYVWKAGESNPEHVALVYPNEIYEWDSQQWSTCFDSTVVDITRGVQIRFAQSQPSTSQCTGPQPQGYVCGGCHD